MISRAGADDAAHERAQLGALYDTATALVDGLELRDVLQAIVERAGELVGTGDGYLYLREPDPTMFRVRVGTGVFEQRIGYALALGEGVAGRAAASGEAVVVDDYETWAGALPDLRHGGFHAVVGVPLHDATGVCGVLGLAHADPGRTFDHATVELLTRFGRLASLALGNAHLYDAAQRELDQRRRVESELRETVAKLSSSERRLHVAHEETVRRLGHAAEFRGADTAGHVERVSRYCGLLAVRIGFDVRQSELLRIASLLHDVGKIAIPDRILLKPGRLTPAEQAVMRRHPEIGHELLAGASSELLDLAATVALTHHERFDGTGYPGGLAGEEIPLAGRIAAVADVFDALTSDRVYRPALSIDEASAMMLAGRGRHLDPAFVDAFVDALPEVREIAAGEWDLATRRGAVTPSPAATPPTARTDAGSEHAAAEAMLDPILLERGADAALAALHTRTDRTAIDDALRELSRGTNGRLIASVYVVEHDRLWLVSQHGYEEVRDGFALDVGVMARAVRTGEVQFVVDAESDADFVHATGGIVSEVALPFGHAHPVGVLNVETIGVSLPSEARAVYRPLATLLAERLDTMRSGLDLDVARLVRLCVHASSLRSVATIAEFATRTVGRLLDVEAVQLDLVSEGAFEPTSFWRREDLAIKPLTPAELLRIRRPGEQTGLDAAYSVLDAREVGVDGAPWVVWLPLTIAGEDVGVLVGRTSVSPHLQTDRAEAATLFAQHIAALVDVSLALRSEREFAVTDALTGLVNRRGFDASFAEELDRASHTGTAVAVVLADCDGLKRINDTGGHPLGDDVLCAIADALIACKRAPDVAARIGGDEFALLVPGADRTAASGIVARLRAELASLPIVLGVDAAASFGIASYPADGRTTTDLLAVADRGLYAEKSRGRDERTVVGRRAVARPRRA